MALEDSFEQALIAFIGDSALHGITLGVNLYQELQDSTTARTPPSAVVKAEQQEECDPETGVFKLAVSVLLSTQADDTVAATQRTQWANLRSILMWSDIPGAINTWAAAQTIPVALYVFPNSVVRDEPMPRTEHDRSWDQEFKFTCWAMPMAGP
jgi:hypothetical protein